MRTINAEWEINNIGLSTVEISYESESDSFPFSIEEKYQHVVVKIPSTYTSEIHLLETSGYYYMENQISLIKNLKNYTLDKKLNSISYSFDIREVKSYQDLKLIDDNIQAGIFDTDRIFLDPLLGPFKSFKRYSNWLKTISISPNYKIFIIYEKKSYESVGFFCIDISQKNHVIGMLAGLFNNFKDVGIGFLLVHFPLKYSIENNYLIYKTNVSSNNIKILNIYSLYSFQFEKVVAVLRKIIK